MKAQLGLLFLVWYQAPAGSLQLEAPPGVSVTWDEAALGQVGQSGIMRLEEIPPGDYLLRLTLDGQLVFSRQVVVRPGTQRLRAVLDLAEPESRDSETSAGQRRPDSALGPRQESAQEAGEAGRVDEFEPPPQRAVPESGVEQRASSMADPKSNPGWFAIVAVAFGVLAVLWFWRRTLVAEHMAAAATKPLSPGGEVPPAGHDVAVLPVIRLPTSDRRPRSTFLDDLRRREEETDRPSRAPLNDRALGGTLEVEVIPEDDDSAPD